MTRGERERSRGERFRRIAPTSPYRRHAACEPRLRSTARSIRRICRWISSGRCAVGVMRKTTAVRAIVRSAAADLQNRSHAISISAAFTWSTDPTISVPLILSARTFINFPSIGRVKTSPTRDQKCEKFLLNHPRRSAQHHIPWSTSNRQRAPSVTKLPSW